ncbi:hypothetical protein DFA_09879 [Cavenderia fasciculata]|uniref:Uncharacterized protein n=1 Tax=Cavenderia fasciculata TaxID=261658 RepID=F4Q8N7_CACFS|nr:uncharacterized protein DFA_09879 [Cavenderia fasciculata]EGG15056.1 hypothetical protein DFA_09879 [Cavenderia fasciculata]|eukprot:XP_004351776.1 hypothetical protein DFA_09879 [Cavenderia fasciculata]
MYQQQQPKHLQAIKEVLFHNKYLFLKILKYIRRDVMVRGALVPPPPPTIINHDFVKGAALVEPPKRYLELTYSVSFLVNNKYYGTLIDIIKCNRLASDALSVGGHLAQVDDHNAMKRLIDLLYQPFKSHFTINIKNTVTKDLEKIKNFLYLLVSHHGNIKVWRVVCDFINTNGLVQDKGKSSKKEKSNITSIMQLMFANRSDGYFAEILRQAVLFNRLDIVVDIVQDVGADRIIKYYTNPLKRMFLPKNQVLEFKPELADPETLTYLYNTFGDTLFSTILFPTTTMTMTALLMTYNIDIIQKNLHRFSHNKEEFYKSFKVTLNHFFTFVVGNQYIQESIGNSRIKSLYDCSLVIMNHLHFDLTLIHKTASHLFPPSTTTMVTEWYQVIVLFELFQLTIDIYSMDRDILCRMVSQFGNSQNCNQNIANYMVDKCGFNSVCKSGSLLLVSLAYQYVQLRVLVTPASSSNFHLISLSSNDLQVLQFLFPIVKDQLHSSSSSSSFNQYNNELYYENQYCINDRIAKGKPQWDVIDYLALESDSSCRFIVSGASITRLLWNGSFAAVDKLIGDDGLIANYIIPSQEVDVNSARMAKYFKREQIIPNFGDNIKKNLELVSYMINVYENQLPLPVFNIMLKYAVYCGDMNTIDRIWGYSNQFIDQQQNNQQPIMVQLDPLIKELKLSTIFELVERSIPLYISSPDSWKIVGQYGHVSWIEDLLLKYTIPHQSNNGEPCDTTIKSEYITKLLDGLKYNTDHKDSIIGYLWEHEKFDNHKSKIKLFMSK